MHEIEPTDPERAKERILRSPQQVINSYELDALFGCQSLHRLRLEYVESPMVNRFCPSDNPEEILNNIKAYLQRGFAMRRRQTVDVAVVDALILGHYLLAPAFTDAGSIKLRGIQAVDVALIDAIVLGDYLLAPKFTEAVKACVLDKYQPVRYFSVMDAAYQKLPEKDPVYRWFRNYPYDLTVCPRVSKYVAFIIASTADATYAGGRLRDAQGLLSNVAFEAWEEANSVSLADLHEFWRNQVPTLLDELDEVLRDHNSWKYRRCSATSDYKLPWVASPPVQLVTVSLNPDIAKYVRELTILAEGLSEHIHGYERAWEDFLLDIEVPVEDEDIDLIDQINEFHHDDRILDEVAGMAHRRRLKQGPEPSAADIYPEDALWSSLCGFVIRDGDQLGDLISQFKLLSATDQERIWDIRPASPEASSQLKYLQLLVDRLANEIKPIIHKPLSERTNGGQAWLVAMSPKLEHAMTVWRLAARWHVNGCSMINNAIHKRYRLPPAKPFMRALPSLPFYAIWDLEKTDNDEVSVEEHDEGEKNFQLLPNELLSKIVGYFEDPKDAYNFRGVSTCFLDLYHRSVAKKLSDSTVYATDTSMVGFLTALKNPDVAKRLLPVADATDVDEDEVDWSDGTIDDPPSTSTAVSKDFMLPLFFH
ncbi:hypothetical protein E8E13_001613 [Curvularia kusanoi]|uniref:Uncharacterized protein n=1 Tax=Curvularia kusanoi TaxID=90978 RepID=A0A9P4W6W5_CURKU|nr:hypothetical protein E8E13_001613 [Curvularia kusanoi]